MEATKLIEERKRLAGTMLRRYAAFGLASGFCTWSIHFAAGRPGDIFLRFVLLISLIATSFQYFKNFRNIEDTIIRGCFWAYTFTMFFGPFLRFDWLISNHPHTLAISAGAFPALAFVFGFQLTSLAKNSMNILTACDEYIKSPRG
jgi:hypothetical protein